MNNLCTYLKDFVEILQKHNFFTEIVNDISSMSLTMFGIEVTLFTVIYSFIIGKKAYLKEVNETIRIEGLSPHLNSLKYFANENIRILKSINIRIFSLTVFSIALYIICLAIKYWKPTSIFGLLIIILLGITAICFLISVIIYLIIIFKQYKKDL